MLYADKRALETNLQVSLLKIREKELQFYTQNCIAIGTQVLHAAGSATHCMPTARASLPPPLARVPTPQAALLSGFAYNGIIQVPASSPRCAPRPASERPCARAGGHPDGVVGLAEDAIPVRHDGSHGV